MHPCQRDPERFFRWLVDNESDACDAVRGTTLGLPLVVDYDELKTKAAGGEVDWAPPSFVYLDGKEKEPSTSNIHK